MFKPTGIVYKLPEAEILRILSEDHGFNYEVLDEDFKMPTATKENIKTIFEQVVEDEEVRSFYDYTVAELKEFCKANGLKANGGKAELLERCLEFTQVDEQASEEV